MSQTRRGPLCEWCAGIGYVMVLFQECPKFFFHESSVNPVSTAQRQTDIQTTLLGLVFSKSGRWHTSHDEIHAYNRASSLDRATIEPQSYLYGIVVQLKSIVFVAGFIASKVHIRVFFFKLRSGLREPNIMHNSRLTKNLRADSEWTE